MPPKEINVEKEEENQTKDFQLRPPHEFKNMMAFPGTTLTHLDASDCNDTIGGTCIIGKTFEQCVDICNKDSSKCSSGYYISNPRDGSTERSICVPLRQSEMGNPYYRIRSKSIYPQLDTHNSTVFVNKDKWRFPPFEANVVFYRDLLTLDNLDSRTGIKDFPLESKTSAVIFNDTTGNGITLQLLHVPALESAGQMFSPVRYGDPIAFNIPSTSLVMEPVNTKIRWAALCEMCLSRDSRLDAFVIVPLEGSHKKEGDKVLYSDSFYLTQDPNVLGIESNTEEARLFYMPISKALSKEIPITFKFSPRMRGFYCAENEKCLPISYAKLGDIDEEGIGTYKGKRIFRVPGCLKTCKGDLTEMRKKFLAWEPSDESKIVSEDKDNNKPYSMFTTIIMILLGIVTIAIISILVYQSIHPKNNNNSTLKTNITEPPKTLSYRLIDRRA